jgi:hypothetical protein
MDDPELEKFAAMAKAKANYRDNDLDAELDELMKDDPEYKKQNKNIKKQKTDDSSIYIKNNFSKLI